MHNYSQFDALLRTFGQDMRSTNNLIQIAILLASLAIGWALSTRLTSHLPTSERLAWRLGRGGISRIAFPAVALAGLVIGKLLYGRGDLTAILNIAISLVGAFALVRLAVYMLRHAFPPHPLLKASEQFIAFLLWSSVALYITGLDAPIVAYLDEPLRLGTYHFTLLAILTALGSVIVTLIVALWLSRLTETRLLRVDTLDRSLRMVLVKFFRALFLVIAVLIALSMAGIDLTVLSVFGGALGVGLGFGLQKVFSNYVSGFIILLDRSIRPGDMITADNRYGRVTQLNTRYTVVKSLDGTEAIIPNDTLMTTTVINHSYSDPRVLLKLELQVAYESPLETVPGLLIEAAHSESRVLRDPPVVAVVKGFADSGINLELQFWITDPENGQSVLKSNILLAIWQTFNRHNIRIPYPLRELRITEVPPLSITASDKLN